MRGSFGSSLFLFAASLPAQHPGDSKTTVVILGVEHSAQLVSETYRPAVFRAFYDRLRPAAIGIERSPEQFARNDHYEFTYEIQYLTVPYARERGIPIHPIDWYPPIDDQMLGWGIDLDAPPILRPASGFKGFLSFPDSAALHRGLFFADSESYRAAQRPWYEKPPAHEGRDLPRRLYLYRTFMQARRIAEMARGYRGKTVLVVIGALHKDEIERILADDSSIRIEQPSAIGLPGPDSVKRFDRPEDFAAIATFNLLGVQSSSGVLDSAWLRRVVGALPAGGPGGEAALLATRLGIITGSLAPDQAIGRYAAIARAAGPGGGFTWTGVKDRKRLDSYFDPFGNLDVRQRAGLEMARELLEVGELARADSVKRELARSLSPAAGAELEGYWAEFVAGKP